MTYLYKVLWYEVLVLIILIVTGTVLEIVRPDGVLHTLTVLFIVVTFISFSLTLGLLIKIIGIVFDEHRLDHDGYSVEIEDLRRVTKR